MSDKYTQQILRVVVAQICQTIGWHSIQSTPLELLVDILHKYLQEITRDTHRHTELYDRTVPNLDDVALTFRNLNININEIEEYINYVDSVSCPFEDYKYPVHKEPSLNFLKPGSKEVLTRPVHIYEYLPPIYPEKEVEDIKIEANENIENIIDVNAIFSTESNIFKKPDSNDTQFGKKSRLLFEEEGRQTREITSVWMTSSGFLSPAREGKLPDSKPPILPELQSVIQPPSPTPQQALPVCGLDNKFDKKRKRPLQTEKDRKKDKINLKEPFKNINSSNQTFKHNKIKGLGRKPRNKIKTKVLNELPNENLFKIIPGTSPNLLTHLLNTAELKKNFYTDLNNHTNILPKTTNNDDIKLICEPNKQKLNIFKKISTVKKEKDEINKSPNIFPDSSILASIPEGTTISPIPSSMKITTPTTYDPNVIVVDDDTISFETNKPKTPNPPVFHGAFQENINTFKTNKTSVQRKPRKRYHQMEQSVPLNLSNEINNSFTDAINMVKKDLINHSRLPSYQDGMKIHKEKKERKKPKAREPKRRQLHQNHQSFNSINPQLSTNLSLNNTLFMDKPLNKDSFYSTDKEFQLMNNKISKFDTSPKLPPFLPPTVGPSFHSMPTIPMFPFYPFSPRPGLIPSGGIFPAIPPMAENSAAFNKYFSMMRFSNFSNVNKGPPLSNFNDDLPPILPPPVDFDSKNYCNVAPLVPDSMKFQLSPTYTPNIPTSCFSTNESCKSKQTMSLSCNMDIPQNINPTDYSSISINNNPPKYLDPPIEISDDEKPYFEDNKDSDSIIKCANIDDEHMSTNINNCMRDTSNSNTIDKVPPTIASSQHRIAIENKTSDENEDATTSDHDEHDEKSDRKKDREHKKGKRDKEGKIKKKKDKKDKIKSREKAEKRKEEKKDKEKFKKMKKEKKKDKMRLLEENKSTISTGDTIDSTIVPKITFKLSSAANSPQSNSSDNKKQCDDDIRDESLDDTKISTDDHRDSSPELARISPLVTRPPKPRQNLKDRNSDNEQCPIVLSTIQSVSRLNTNQSVPRGPGRPRGSGNNSISSNVVSSTSSTPLLTSSNNSSSTTNNTVINTNTKKGTHSTDAEGNQVWICPACGRVDDGTPMIGCDGCDAWYHWVCVGIQVPPDANEDWYCRVCIAKKQEPHGNDKKRKRKKKNKLI